MSHKVPKGFELLTFAEAEAALSTAPTGADDFGRWLDLSGQPGTKNTIKTAFSRTGGTTYYIFEWLSGFNPFNFAA